MPADDRSPRPAVAGGETLGAEARRLLRAFILDGRFDSGDKLIERELSALTGASRSVLREALAHLEAKGLVERESYRGFRVARLSSRKIEEIFELRAALETLAAERFTERASAGEIAELRAALAEIEKSLASRDLPRILTAKRAYYEVLFTGARNDEIRGALDAVFDRIFYLRTRSMRDPTRHKASLEEFRRLTEALAARDRLAARAACLAHLDAARDAVLVGIAEVAAAAEVSG